MPLKVRPQAKLTVHSRSLSMQTVCKKKGSMTFFFKYELWSHLGSSVEHIQTLELKSESLACKACTHPPESRRHTQESPLNNTDQGKCNGLHSCWVHFTFELCCGLLDLCQSMDPPARCIMAQVTGYLFCMQDDFSIPSSYTYSIMIIR